MYPIPEAALAYASFRRGRLPLISSLFEPVFPDGNNRILGKIIDVSAILVTLFGTATSLGIGVLQIRTGMSLVTGRPLNGSAPLVAIISVLSVVFLISAVTGVKEGIRLLSNTNMGLVVILGLFALIAGPTFFLLDLVPASLISFVGHVPEMFSRYASAGEGEKTWMIAWTSLYWAWWISWSPFVGMFIAKISKGRTLREFTFVVLFAPTSISVLWFTVFGGNAIWQNKEGKGLKVDGAGENVMFDLLRNLPLGNITVVIALAAIVVFFVTAADSATNVMGSMSQSGRPVASTPVTIIWGVLMAATALFLLLAGGRNALSGLQSIMVTSAIIFAVIVIGILVAFARDLATDPQMIRRKYAFAAIRKGVSRGIDEHGDDFVFSVDQVAPEEGAGADFASDDPSLTSWYTETAQDAEASQDAKTSQDEPADERHEVATTTGVETEAESKDELRG